MTDPKALAAARDYLLSHIQYDPNGGCWLWDGALSSTGYAVAGADNIRMHRVSYEILVGEIPNGLHIDHLCRVRCCVNPAHLEPVTVRENTLRGIGPTAENARKTHCTKGHLLDENNTISRRFGWRACRECQRGHQRRWRASRKV